MKKTVSGLFAERFRLSFQQASVCNYSVRLRTRGRSSGDRYIGDIECADGSIRQSLIEMRKT
ncbi:MAG: hypothetical protein WDA22_15780 [Bacteroidota bacterium]